MRRPRSSIAGLMGVVLVASLCLAALRSPTQTWAGVIFISTCGVLAFGVVGALCGRETDRPWWIGFTVFGWGYMFLSLWIQTFEFWLWTDVTIDLLERLMAKFGVPKIKPHSFSLEQAHFAQIGHCLWGLLFATLGGLLSHLVFAPSVRPGRADTEETRSTPASRRRWLMVVKLTIPILFTYVAWVGARKAPGLWAGATFLLTWGLLGLAALGAICRRGKRRTRWLGATLFGVGYMMLVFGQSSENWPEFATNRLLNALRPWLPTVPQEFPAASDGIAFANVRILKALERPIPMRFPKETPLEDFLKYVVEETQAPDGRKIGIYVDPVGLQESEKTMQSPLTMEIEEVPLRTTLRLALRQLGLAYSVKDGLLLITSEFSGDDENLPAYQDPFLVIGQCLLAVLAAGLGSFAAPWVAGPRGKS